MTNYRIEAIRTVTYTYVFNLQAKNLAAVAEKAQAYIDSHEPVDFSDTIEVWDIQEMESDEEHDT